MATANRHDVRTKQRVGQDLGHAVVAQHVVEDLAALGRNLVDIRFLAVGLVEIGLLEALYRCQRVGLAIAGESPRPDRTADQVDRPNQLRHHSPQNRAIELAEHQPFRAT